MQAGLPARLVARRLSLPARQHSGSRFKRGSWQRGLVQQLRGQSLLSWRQRGAHQERSTACSTWEWQRRR